MTIQNSSAFTASFNYEKAEVPAGAGMKGHLSIDDFVDEVFEHLSDKLHMKGVNIVLNTESQQMIISVSIPGDADQSPEQVISEGMSVIRTALHATGGFTPHWQSVDALASV